MNSFPLDCYTVSETMGKMSVLVDFGRIVFKSESKGLSSKIAIKANKIENIS
jgi:hypothetical protein